MQHLLRAARVALERLPLRALLHQHPDALGAGDGRQMLGHRHANAVEVECATERLAERHEPLEVFGAVLCFFGRELRGGGLRLLLMVSEDLMEHESACQQHQRGKQRQPTPVFDFACIVQQTRY